MILKEILKYAGFDLNGAEGSVGVVPVDGFDVNYVLYNFSLMTFIFSVISLLCDINKQNKQFNYDIYYLNIFKLEDKMKAGDMSEEYNYN
jgi:hypothetical protein